MKNTRSLVIALASAASFATAGDPVVIDDKNPCPCDCKWDSHRPDSHAPIGIMGDHTHEAGEVMLSYRYMVMDMRPNYIGGDEAPRRTIQGPPNGRTFPIIPTNMRTEMHMIGAMYAPSDRLTLMGMLPRIDMSMDHIFMNGTTFRTHTDGIGDFKFGGLLKVFDENCQRIHLNLMMSAPTGSIDETGFVPPAGGVVRLPYPMQLGSGTWDLLPGVTYLGQSGCFSWGGQVLGTLRLGQNDEGYSLGDGVTANGWVARQLSDSLSASVRGTYRYWGDVDGADRLLNPMAVPTARPDLRGGESIDLFGGLNYQFVSGILEGHRLSVEAGGTVWRDLDGPQLGMDWMAIVGWQKAF